MVVNCQHVWREISNYLDGEIDAETRAAMEAHIAQCKH
jgi:anti-sigma factor RsiW